MRLLEILSNDSLQFTEDLYTDIPPYAILSHTWGHDNDEITYKDMYKGRGKEKLGYQKLKLCQKWTKDKGLRYFWVDTCCIDKRNLAEISEAINSMYRWYEESETCFAYLADVHHDSQKVLDEEAFRSSRWFTRGWTLQELIAPSSVEFYSNEGWMLGDTGSLKDLIAAATGIPPAVLIEHRDRKLLDYSPEQRISWFTGRQTKRPEDSIYCLLGLLGVSMPLLYGEGIANAARRLGREIDEMKRDERREADSTSGLAKALLQFSIHKPVGAVAADQMSRPASLRAQPRPHASATEPPQVSRRQPYGGSAGDLLREHQLRERAERAERMRKAHEKELAQRRREERMREELLESGESREAQRKQALTRMMHEREREERRRQEVGREAAIEERMTGVIESLPSGGRSARQSAEARLAIAEQEAEARLSAEQQRFARPRSRDRNRLTTAQEDEAFTAANRYLNSVNDMLLEPASDDRPRPSSLRASIQSRRDD